MKRSPGGMRPALLVSLLILVGGGQMLAQALVGRVQGMVRDEAGKALAGATISATNPEQSLTLTATTDAKGRFGILAPRRGIWVFAVDAPGFQKTSQAYEIQLGTQNPAMNIKLVRNPVPPPPGPLANLSAADIQTRIDAAEAAASAGDLAGAVTTYRDLLTKVPALTTGYLRVGALLEQKGDTAAALAAYRDLVRLEPDNSRAAAAIARLTRTP